MIIDHVNTLLSGGAAVAARRLHVDLRKAGIDSRLWYGKSAEPAPTDRNMYQAPWPLPDASRMAATLRCVRFFLRACHLRMLRSYYRRGTRQRQGGFLGVRLPQRTPYVGSIFEGEVVHFHWIGKLIDFQSFFSTMPLEKPLVWTLHDMNPMTGGCSHAMDCDGFTRACGDCPILARPGPHDLSFQELKIKFESLQGRNVRLVAPSHWMAGMARRSALFQSFPVDVIRNPIDLGLFRPVDRRQARERFGLPQEGVGLLFAAESLEVVGKGVSEYIETLSRIRPGSNVFGITFGRGKIRSEVNGIPIRNLGYLSDHEALRSGYSAADIFVMPSHADTISQTIVEAFACGIPTAAFSVGGIPELVQNGRTGFLADFCDVAQLTDRVQWLIDHPAERREIGQGGMELVQEEFASSLQIKKYVDLYHELIANRGGRKPISPSFVHATNPDV